jgi:hypothetical protein
MPEEEKQQGSKYNPETVDDAKKIIEALEKRLAERDADNQKLKSEIGDYGKRLKAIEDGQQQQLVEQGNYKAIAEKLQADLTVYKTKAERADSLDAVIRQANEAAIARIPESRRSLIPTDYPPEKLQDFLAKNTALLMREPAPDFNAGEGAGGERTPAKLTDAEKEAASLLGAKPETIEKLKALDAKK